MNPLKLILLCLSGWVNQEQQAVIDFLQEEIRILREILGKRPRFNDRQRRRLAAKAKRIRYGKLKEIANIATPQTLLRWFRTLIAKKYDSTCVRRPGRPSTKDEIVQLVVRMANENETWGYTRIRDAIENLGHEISRDTVANILRDHCIEPAPERGPKTTWAKFLKRQWEVMSAADFFTVEVWTLKGIVRYQVLFVMKLATREVHIAGIAQQGHGPWMEQIARNLTDTMDGFLKDCRFFIFDRDRLFTKSFRQILESTGMELVRLPRRSPNLNAFAERFVKSIKFEGLNQLIFLSEDSLRYAINEYIAHYHHERNHQGLDSKIIIPKTEQNAETGVIVQRERLGGLLNFYHRKAA